MRKILLLLLLPYLLYASKILSYNIYDRSDRVDVMITFDTPYDGIIKQSLSDGTITIKLEDSSIESSKLKQLNSKYIKSISITPLQGYTQIVAQVPPSINLQASKTSDSYGLRLRFSPQLTLASQSTKRSGNSNLKALPTKQSEDISSNYYIVVAILIIGIAILFFLKTKFPSASNKTTTNSWLFQENRQEQKEIVPQTTTDGVSIRFQKSINSDNSVVMLDFMEQSYLVLMGKSNILLDKFTDNKPVTQSEFETILQSRHKQLSDFLNYDEESKEALHSYKERAASISYEV